MKCSSIHLKCFIYTEWTVIAVSGCMELPLKTQRPLQIKYLSESIATWSYLTLLTTVKMKGTKAFPSTTQSILEVPANTAELG